MNVSYAAGTVFYGLRLDCDKNGCLEKFGFIHEDNGTISQMDPKWEPGYPKRTTINGHACTVVTRTMPDWVEA